LPTSATWDLTVLPAAQHIPTKKVPWLNHVFWVWFNHG